MLKNLSIKGRGEENKPVQETEQQTGDRETVKTVTCPIPKGVRFRDRNRTQRAWMRVGKSQSAGALETDHSLYFLMLYSLGLKVLLKGNREKARIQPT